MNFNVDFVSQISCKLKKFQIEFSYPKVEHDFVGFPDCAIFETEKFQQKSLLNKFHPDPDVGAVVVGYYENFSFMKMMKAATYLKDPEMLFIGTNADQNFLIPGLTVPGAGAILKAIETCSERTAVVMGKPEKWIFETLFSHQIAFDPKKVLMIGDRLNTDMLFGKIHNFQTLFVQTGVHKIEKVQEIIREVNNGVGNLELERQIPDFYISSLGDLFNNCDSN